MRKLVLIICLAIFATQCKTPQSQNKTTLPNIVLIYADDLGSGDISAYGGKIATPNIDKLADNGIIHTNAYATASTCTPSRYSLLTGQYAWRQSNRGVLNADAMALIPKGQQSVASLLKSKGYRTAVVGKWHLGLGTSEGIDWNTELQNTPNDIGFDYSFIIPATSDRVPCVYVENRKVVNLDLSDPIHIDYHKPIGMLPTGKNNPELLKLKYSHGHDMTIFNGISRIGYQSGGSHAVWKDEDIADDLVNKAKHFISKNTQNPFFLYLATNNIHVPRMPHQRFQGKSGYGLRGDAIIELDAMVKEITAELERLHLSENTIIIFSSDNGAVLDDGYADEAIATNKNHTPNQQLRGGKYSSYEAGTRVPFIVSWKGQLQKTYSKALVSQIDFIGSLCELLDIPYDATQATDTQKQLSTWLGKNTSGRSEIIQEAVQKVISIVQGQYKYIPPSQSPMKQAWETGIETGFQPTPQLYDLTTDPQEQKNIADKHPDIVKALHQRLETIKNSTK